MAQLVQMTETELPCGFVVRNHIIGIQARKIAVQQHQRIILQLHGQQLVAEEGLILGKQDNSGDIQFQASLKQIIFHSGIVALENMADISILRKNGLDAVDHGQGKGICDRRKNAGDFRHGRGHGRMGRGYRRVPDQRGKKNGFGHKGSLMGKTGDNPLAL